MQGAWKVGLLVIVFGGLLFGAYGVIGKSLFAPEMDRYVARFPDATGLAKGGAVLISGVKVGVIEDVDLAADGYAVVSFAIPEGQRLAAGSRAAIQSQLIGFGDVPMIVVSPPGVPKAFLKVGAVLEGSKSSPMEGMFPEFKSTAEELNRTLAAVRDFMTDQSLKDNLTKLMLTANATVERFGKLAGEVQGVVADNRVALAGAMRSLDGTMKDVQEAAKIAAKLMKDDKWKVQAEVLLESLNRTAVKAEELMGNVNDLVTDPQLRDPLNKAAANFQAITDSGTRIAANTEEMTKNGVAISKNVEEVTRKASELADEAREVLKKLQDFFQKVPSTSGIKKVTTEMDLIHQNSPPHWRTDFTATYPLSDGRVIAGVYDAFEGNKLTLQFGKDAAKSLGYRYGVYASKPAVGVDFRLATRWDLRGDLYDINDPTLDFRSRFDLGNGWLGWIGVDKIFNKNALSLGLGIRK